MTTNATSCYWSILRKVVVILVLFCFIVNVSPVYASPYYGVDKSYPVWEKLGQWLGKEVNFQFKFGWDVQKIDYANKVMKCVKCKKRIDMATYAFTRGTCEKCYDGDKKALKQFISAKLLQSNSKSKVRNIKDYQISEVDMVSVGLMGLLYSMKDALIMRGVY